MRVLEIQDENRKQPAQPTPAALQAESAPQKENVGPAPGHVEPKIEVSSAEIPVEVHATFEINGAHHEDTKPVHLVVTNTEEHKKPSLIQPHPTDPGHN